MSPTHYFYFVKLPLIGAIVSLLGMGIFAKRGLLDWQRMVKQNDLLGDKVELARLRKEDLERQIDILRTDRVAQERVVRQYLGYIRQDELIVEFP
jgi:hypothetical protein